MRIRLFVCAALALLVTVLFGSVATADARIKLREYRLSDSRMEQLRERWINRLAARHAEGDWAELRVNLTNRDLRLMGLPRKRVLMSRRYKQPTFVTSSGTANPVGLPTVTTFAGTGFFGIRPGAWLLFISGNSIGWCSAAHVYGSPGSYDISTAGHCGRPGDIVTVIAAAGNRGDATGVVLLDFGTIQTSHDGGLGDDWALIDISPAYQNLVTPTMAFWGGPRGIFTKEGAVAGVTIPRNGFVPSVQVNPDPFLAQQIVHYGHGTGLGPGGTPRSGTAIAWGTRHYMFFGAISPGDSGSGANTLGGDNPGDNMEAAGIMTHLYIDPLMRQGLGIMGGTRATQVSGTLANGQLLPYPAPIPAAP